MCHMTGKFSPQLVHVAAAGSRAVLCRQGAALDHADHQQVARGELQQERSPVDCDSDSDLSCPLPMLD